MPIATREHVVVKVDDTLYDAKTKTFYVALSRVTDDLSAPNVSEKKVGNSVEMMAFMKMFMDLVGIFGEDSEITMEGRTAGGSLLYIFLFS